MSLMNTAHGSLSEDLHGMQALRMLPAWLLPSPALSKEVSVITPHASLSTGMDLILMFRSNRLVEVDEVLHNWPWKLRSAQRSPASGLPFREAQLRLPTTALTCAISESVAKAFRFPFRPFSIWIGSNLSVANFSMSTTNIVLELFDSTPIESHTALRREDHLELPKLVLLLQLLHFVVVYRAPEVEQIVHFHCYRWVKTSVNM